MRYVSSAAAIAIVLSALAPSMAFGQASNLSITNYQYVSDVPLTVTSSYVTYQAELVNTGPALPGVTATVTSLSSSVQVVAGQGTLQFAPVPANSQVTSLNTFTILVNRSVAFDFDELQWSFTSPVANPGPNQTATVPAQLR